MIVVTIVALLFALSGLALGAGGIWLAVLGGSWYYAALGIALLYTGWLVWRRSAVALWVYAVTLLVTLIWALWEVGLDWWQLAPRGGWLLLLGLILALPWVVNRIEDPADRRRGFGWIALGGTIGVAAIVGIIAMFTPTHDMPGRLPNTPLPAEAALDDPSVPPGEWHAYGRTTHGQRFSPLTQITPENVNQLQVAWTFNTGQIRSDADPEETTYQVTPLKIGNMLYLCTPFGDVIALDPETGEQIWRFDAQVVQTPRQTTQHLTCRGLSFDPGGVTTADGTAPLGDCAQRLFLPTSDGRLIALSPVSGQICPGFGGEDGTVDLWQNMPNVIPGSYYSTSPPVVTDSVIIVGGAVNDNVTTNDASGVIRAFDLATGELVWNWDSLNPEATEPIAEGETYTANAPNSWSIGSYDPALRLVYLPMANQSPDQYGANRSPEAERFSSSVTALNADTGEVVWVYQTVHHDLWDYDVPAQPSLIDLNVSGAMVPALVIPTKQGDIFVLNRETGVPVLPVSEDPAPQGAVPGDFTAPTQPRSLLSFEPPPLRERDMWGITPFDQLMCRIAFRQLDYRGRYTPPSLQGTIVYPGNFGTFNWGSIAVDPERQVMFGMPVYLAFTVRMIPRPADDTRVVTEEGEPLFNESFGSPYAVEIQPFYSPLDLPCQAPPWGYVAAADLTTGEVAYRHVNGTVRDLAPVPLPFKMGVPGIGGPIITRSGLAFLSGTVDYFVRGYELETGRQLWESRLPAGGQATPMTYWSDASDRQFLLVVAGGHGSVGTQAGDYVVAYALPRS